MDTSTATNIPPSRAPPTLGSALLAHAQTRHTHHPPSPPASSGAAAIDSTALNGGYRYGEITSLAGTSGTGKTLLAYHAVASHLLARHDDGDGQGGGNGGGEVAFVDTTGGFSPVRLRDVISLRLMEREWRVARRGAGGGDGYGGRCAKREDGFMEEATELLERVKLMRVFDFAGMVEAIGEVGEMRERKTERARGDPVKERAQLQGEIGDSEEEAESDDEMLHGKSTYDGDNNEPAAVDGRSVGEGCVGMIIIDIITNVASSVVSKSPVQGQVLLTSFMRSLQHLTSQHQMCTLLVNSAVGTNPSTNPEYHRHPDDNVSMFSSSLGKPALGKSFTYFLDMSIFLSMLPKTSNDAVTAYGGVPEGQVWQKAIVLEVVKDRYGTREGRWMAFEIGGALKLVPYAT